jgi:hypothetical protein
VGYLDHVRVINTVRGQKKILVLFFYDRVKDLLWDPAPLSRTDGTAFMDFTTQKGRHLLHNRHTPPSLIATKWNMVLPSNFSFQWSDMWDSEKARKEARLLW